MIFERDKNYEFSQLNRPSHLSFADTKKITTIAELRHNARQRNRKKSVQYQERQAQRLTERFEFSKMMVEMCERLAYVFNIENSLTIEAIHSLFDSHNWYADGHFHSVRTPLSIRFIKPLSFGGQLEIGNVAPCYNGMLPGEYEIHRNRPNFRPHPEAVIMGSLTA